MHSTNLVALLSFLVAPLVGCAQIPKAPEATQRMELEVAVNVDPTISGMLHQSTAKESVERIVASTILSLADIGLRFYPVPSETYGEQDEHPDFLLTIDIQTLRAKLDQRVVRNERELSNIETGIDSLSCSALATFVRRRPHGPSLIVGQALGRGDTSVREASAVLSSEVQLELTPASGGKAPSFSASELERSIRRAVGEALAELVEPIDRELAFHPGLEGALAKVR